MSKQNLPILFDSTTIDQLQWPSTEEGRKAKDYLYPLIKEGVKYYLRNVSTKIYLLSYKDLLLPLTINEKEYENSYVTSNYYVLKYYEEAIAKKSRWQLYLQKPLLYLGGIFLRWFKINKALFLNNWLITGSLVPDIAEEDLKIVTNFLAQKFPKHTIMFRGVDARMKQDLLNSLKRSRFHLLKTREVYFYNPEEKSGHSKNMRKTGRQDLKIIQKLNLEIVRSEDIQERDYPRLLQLYEMLYVNKYTRYSPHYSEKYIRNTHQKKMVTYVALKRAGVIEGFFSYFTHNKTMINCLFGYDTKSPHSHDLYKILTRLVLEEADRLKLFVNDGSGSDSAKSLRGLKPFPEYMGLYNSHLPLSRRLFWSLVAYIYNKLE